MTTKYRDDAAAALAEVVKDGMTIAVGGFGLSGNPTRLIKALRDSGATNLTIVSNNMGVDGKGLGLLLENKQVSKVLASYVGENKLFAQQFLNGDLDVEFCPQGTLAERLRAGGVGIPAFFTPTGVGTPVAEGKEVMEFNGKGRHTFAEAEHIREDFLDPSLVETPGIFVQTLVQADETKDIEQRTVRSRQEG